MDALPLSDPRALASALEQTIADRLGPRAGPVTLAGRLLASIEDRAAAMSPPAAPLDAKARAALVEGMGDDLDQLEDQLEALALAAGPAGGG
jgi:hypothetical protein